VGTTNVPPVGAPDTVISNVSLVPADLLRGPAATPPATSAPAAR
jgi:hypothetical protein